MDSLVRPVTFGRVEREDGIFVIDAEPHVMVRLRQLFKGARGQGEGEHTHRRVSVPRTPETAKDLLWVCSRYPLEIEPGVLAEMEQLAHRYDRCIAAAAVGDTNTLIQLSPLALPLAEPTRPHQSGAVNLFDEVGRLLLGDDLGLGKTISAIASLCEPDTRPALVVVPTPLTRQWQDQFKRFLPGASTYVIKGRKPHKLPEVDVVITAYTRLQGWEDTLVPHGFKTVIFDEVQDLRHVGTTKREIARAASNAADRCLGLSATPIYNMGAEIWSVVDVLAPDALGPQADFRAEWCTGEKVRDTHAMHSYLKAQGLLLRRRKVDVGQADLGEPQREVITLEGDLDSLAALRDVARALAMSVLSNRVGESAEASKELDWRLRQATGVAKARAVAEFVKMLVASGEKVVLAGWHRECYEIWAKELASCKPVFYTGTETTAQKVRAVKEFVEGQSSVFVLSLRSGAGLDGLQRACSVLVFGELDWSPQVMEQVIGRLHREGQRKPVTAYWLTIDDGSDPFVLEVLTDKRAQSDGIVDGLEAAASILEDNGDRSDRIRAMAEGYLASIGEAAPVVEPTEGLHAEVTTALRRLALPTNSEREMQEAIADVLPQMLRAAEVEREVPVGQRSRLDFLAIEGEERIAIECKIDQAGRAAVYRQVRRYAEECGVTGVIVVAPWAGVGSFVVDGIPVTVVDYTKAALRKGRSG